MSDTHILWREVVSEVHRALIGSKISIHGLRVGDIEFGALEVTQAVRCGIDEKTASLVVVDAAGMIGDAPVATAGVKPGLRWLEFQAYIEEQCIVNGLLPSEIGISHLEVRPKLVTDLSIYVDKRFKQLCITDEEDRINGMPLGQLR